MEVRERLGQGQRLMAELQGLVRIAQQPQDPACIAQAARSQVLSGDDGQRAILVGITEGHPPVEVRLAVVNSPSRNNGSPHAL